MPNGGQGLGHGQRGWRETARTVILRARAPTYKCENASAAVTLDHVEPHRSGATTGSRHRRRLQTRALQRGPDFIGRTRTRTLANRRSADGPADVTAERCAPSDCVFSP